jgi:hypothetical protein
MTKYLYISHDFMMKIKRKFTRLSYQSIILKELNLEFDSQNDKNALGIGSLVVFLVEKVRTIFVFSFVLKCFLFFFEE